MELKQVHQNFCIADQITPQDITTIAQQGIKTIICNRPDDEEANQPKMLEMYETAFRQNGIQLHYLPIINGHITEDHIFEFQQLYLKSPKPVLAYCRSGMRSMSLWVLSSVAEQTVDERLRIAKSLGYDLYGLIPRILETSPTQRHKTPTFSVVIVGAGAAGIAVAASLRSRQHNLDIVLIDPAENHYYQPGWTMVGGGVFHAEQTKRNMQSLIPEKVTWMKASVTAFDPDYHRIQIDGHRSIQYKVLVVCTGLKLNWQGIDGLAETLGKNGVTSNYRYDLAPYTWKLVQNLKSGKALFTQPPIPIKCAGAPQKAMYLSANYWQKQGVLNNIDIEFYNSGAVLFGVEAYVPALMKYIKKYDVALNFNHQLIRIDGEQKRAWFKVSHGEKTAEFETDFDMIHVVPPQQAPDFVRASYLVDETGWVSVNQHTLQHTQYPDIFALGDVINAPNAKTVAAARKQAPIVAHNILQYLNGSNHFAQYDGYGSCPLTVEHGKIILAEFGYGGKLLPSFPKWFLNGQEPTKMAWLLKTRILPALYWDGMLKGREWFAKPKL